MSPRTRRTLTLGAAAMLGATTLLAGPVSAQDVPQGGTIIVGEWQTAEQLNPMLTNALKDFEAIRPAQRPLAGVNDAGEFVPELLAEFPSLENGGIVPDEDGAGFTMNLKLHGRPDVVGRRAADAGGLQAGLRLGRGYRHGRAWRARTARSWSRSSTRIPR